MRRWNSIVLQFNGGCSSEDSQPLEFRAVKEVRIGSTINGLHSK